MQLHLFDNKFSNMEETLYLAILIHRHLFLPISNKRDYVFLFFILGQIFFRII